MYRGFESHRFRQNKKDEKNFVFFIFTVYVGFEQAGSRKSQEFLYFYFATKQSGGLFTASACRAKFILRRANPTVSAKQKTDFFSRFFCLRLIWRARRVRRRRLVRQVSRGFPACGCRLYPTFFFYFQNICGGMRRERRF